MSELEVKLSEDDSWELLKCYTYESLNYRIKITVPKGFKTDFASIPRLPFIFWFLGDRGHEAAVVHDYIYARALVDRKTADGIFREALHNICGMNSFLCTIYYLGVRIFGGSHYDRNGTE